MQIVRAKFDRFWYECEAVLNEEVGVAMDDHRHSEVTHLASAISIRDIWECVKGFLPTPLFPARSVSIYNFGRKHSVRRKLYTWEAKHPMSGNMPACSVNTAFLSIDEKHKIKVGEPNFPVAAAERGRQVVVSMNKSSGWGS